MNVRDAAIYLSARGYRCSPGTVRALAKAGKVSHYRPGVTGRGRLEFTEAWLDELLRDAAFRGAPTPLPEKPVVERKPRDKPVLAAKPGGWRSAYDDELGA